MIPDTSAYDHRAVYFPAGTPAEIRESFTVTEWRGADCTLNCRVCLGLDGYTEFAVRCGTQDMVLPEYVRILARHLFCIHHRNPLHGAATGKAGK